MTENQRQSPTAESAAADILGPKSVLDIQNQGKAAVFRGDHVNSCPWAEPKDEKERASRDMWIRGYSMGRTELRQARDQR